MGWSGGERIKQPQVEYRGTKCRALSMATKMVHGFLWIPEFEWGKFIFLFSFISIKNLICIFMIDIEDRS
jgi:hypothetical protein